MNSRIYAGGISLNGINHNSSFLSPMNSGSPETLKKKKKKSKGAPKKFSKLSNLISINPI